MKRISNLLILFPFFCFAQDSVVVKVPIGQSSGMTAVLNYLLRADSTNGYSTRWYTRYRIDSIVTALGAKGTSNFDGNYNSLSNRPSIPTNNNELTNGAGYITSFTESDPLAVKITDSATMLLKYLRKQDTAFMLSPYIRANVAAATYQVIGSYATTSQNALKVNISDTAAAFSPYLRVNVAAATYQLAGTYATGSGSASGVNTGDQDLSGLAVKANNLSDLTNAATARTNLGATTVGSNLFTLTNPSAIRFIRINANNTITTRTASEMLLDIGGQVAGSYQAFNNNLSVISGLTPTTDNFLVGVASDWASRTPAQVKTTLALDNVTNTSDANKPVSTAQQTALDLKANLSTTPQIVASINATAQAANIATATLYAVPSAGFYRVSIYIAVTQAATTSSTMPSTTITYTDGNAGTNAHSTTTTATSAGNSVTTTFAQTTYVLYAKASTNIQYATGSYATSGATGMQYALRIRVEAL